MIIKRQISFSKIGNRTFEQTKQDNYARVRAARTARINQSNSPNFFNKFGKSLSSGFGKIGTQTKSIMSGISTAGSKFGSVMKKPLQSFNNAREIREANRLQRRQAIVLNKLPFKEQDQFRDHSAMKADPKFINGKAIPQYSANAKALINGRFKQYRRNIFHNKVRNILMGNPNGEGYRGNAQYRAFRRGANESLLLKTREGMNRYNTFHRSPNTLSILRRAKNINRIRTNAIKETSELTKKGRAVLDYYGSDSKFRQDFSNIYRQPTNPMGMKSLRYDYSDSAKKGITRLYDKMIQEQQAAKQAARVNPSPKTNPTNPTINTTSNNPGTNTPPNTNNTNNTGNANPVNGGIRDERQDILNRHTPPKQDNPTETSSEGDDNSPGFKLGRFDKAALLATGIGAGLHFLGSRLTKQDDDD